MGLYVRWQQKGGGSGNEEHGGSGSLEVEDNWKIQQMPEMVSQDDKDRPQEWLGLLRNEMEQHVLHAMIANESLGRKQAQAEAINGFFVCHVRCNAWIVSVMACLTKTDT